MINKCIVVGNLGQDPKIVTFDSGRKIANLSVATSYRWKSKDGEKQERTTWHRVVVHGEHDVKFAEKFLKKGMRVYCEGSYESRKYDDKGTEREVMELIIRPFGGSLQAMEKLEGGGDRVPGADEGDYAGY